MKPVGSFAITCIDCASVMLGFTGWGDHGFNTSATSSSSSSSSSSSIWSSSSASDGLGLKSCAENSAVGLLVLPFLSRRGERRGFEFELCALACLRGRIEPLDPSESSSESSTDIALASRSFFASAVMAAAGRLALGAMSSMSTIGVRFALVAVAFALAVFSFDAFAFAAFVFAAFALVAFVFAALALAALALAAFSRFSFCFAMALGTMSSPSSSPLLLDASVSRFLLPAFDLV